VYGAALGGWIYIIVDSFLSLISRRSYIGSIVSAVSLGCLTIWEFQRLGGKGRPEPTDEITRLLTGTKEQE
jgi:hypothetical protein